MMGSAAAAEDDAALSTAPPRSLVVCVGPSYSSSSRDVIVELAKYKHVDVASVEIVACGDDDDEGGGGEGGSGGGSGGGSSAMADYFRAQYAASQAKKKAAGGGTVTGVVTAGSLQSRVVLDTNVTTVGVGGATVMSDEDAALYRGGVYTLCENHTPDDLAALARRIQRESCGERGGGLYELNLAEHSHLKCDILVSKFAFQMQRVPLQGGGTPPRRRVTAVVNLADNGPRVTDALARMLGVPGNDTATSDVRGRGWALHSTPLLLRRVYIVDVKTLHTSTIYTIVSLHSTLSYSLCFDLR
jgi:hypothetical protein